MWSKIFSRREGMAMSNLNLKGLWIPIEILTDKNLSDKEKVIFSLIVFLKSRKTILFLY